MLLSWIEKADDLPYVVVLDEDNQLADILKQSYQRVLVVPKAHEDAGQAFVDEHGHRLCGEYHLVVPSTVTELL